MEPFVLYCKSFRNDVLRVKVLTESIRTFNKERIPFYISVPTADMDLFNEHLEGLPYTLIKDEDILLANPRHSLPLMDTFSGGLMQQIIKSEFWRLGLCRNYLMLDSDCYFIKDFTVSDFMYDALANSPFSVCCSGTMLWYKVAANCL